MYIFLKEQDAKGAETIDMFCDGCAGQNKNSIVPVNDYSIFELFFEHTNSELTHYMVPNHGSGIGNNWLQDKKLIVNFPIN